jgi:hypothetical protein
MDSKKVDSIGITVGQRLFLVDMIHDISISVTRYPVKILDNRVMVIADGGGPIAFQGFVEMSIFKIQHETKIHS